MCWITRLPLLPLKLLYSLQIVSHANKDVHSGIIVQPVLFSKQAGHVVYTLTIDRVYARAGPCILILTLISALKFIKVRVEPVVGLAATLAGL